MRHDPVSPGEAAEAHALTTEEALALCGASIEGLSTAEAALRLRQHGPNRLPAQRRTHPALRFLAQFNNALIYFLLASSVAAFLLDHRIDAAVILAVVLINAAIGFIQEGKAEDALDAIRDMIAPHAIVLRGGNRVDVEADEIVPGDVVLLEAGDKVPADLRVLHSRNCLVDEAILTGESVPVMKADAPVAADAALGDRASMMFSGTLVATGQARGLAVATGSATQIGRISRMIGAVGTLTTPLLQQINHFGRLFTWFALVTSVLLFAFATLVRGYQPVEAMMVVVSLAVGVVPEGLPAVITITLALGVRRMAARHAIVRRLPAVETLGSTSVICSDKTGTLTKNEMTVRRLVTGDATWSVSGTGYTPEGAIGDGWRVEDEPSSDLALLVHAGLLCNDATLKHTESGWTVIGDPMEGALVALAAKAGVGHEEAGAQWRRLDAIPFDTEHRYMATLSQAPDGTRWIFVKGAPERVLAMCGLADDAGWHRRIALAAGEGERVLGFAAHPAAPDTATLDMDELQDGLRFLGLAGFIDPPRPEALAAIADCRKAGIAVKMITGDHKETASAIARQLHLADDPVAVTGADLDRVPDEALPALALKASVFARTNPEHKLRIVRALQSTGAVVAMTGDGVNDAPSLKQADVGVAMGRKGTEAAKEASETVLADDNFASIVAAVREGRTVYDNIRKVIAWTLPTNGGEVLAVVVALFVGMTLPMTPAQILWINMILTVTLGLVLAFEPPEPGVMARPPRPRDAPLLSRFLLWRVAFVSVLFTMGVFAVFQWAMWRDLGESAARTMVVNALVVMEIFYLFNVRYLHARSISLRGILGTPILLAALAAVTLAQFAFTYLPVMHTLFASAPIPFMDGLLILALGVLVLLVLEAEKWFLSHRRIAID